ncbi:MAG: hypothetical protein Q7R91_00240 [bacterium]|nr:hypothetical protein [bacterium]
MRPRPTNKECVVALWRDGLKKNDIITRTGFERTYVEGVLFDLESRDDLVPNKSEHADENTISSLCYKFQEHLARWTALHPKEETQLASLLAIWGQGYPKTGTLWEKIGERLVAIAERKSAQEALRPQNHIIEKRGGKTIHLREEPKNFTAEDIMLWLCESSIADEWMLRFREQI